MKQVGLTLLFCLAVYAQRSQPLVNQRLTKPVIYAYTVATLPTSGGGLAAGAVAVVNDALTAGSCTVAGGTAIALCRWNGSAWISLGGTGGGGGAAATVDLTDFKPTAAGAVITIQAGRGRMGNYASPVIALGTATVTGGSGNIKVFIDSSNNLVCYRATGITTTDGGAMACSTVTTPTYPANSIPIGDFTASAGPAVALVSDDRAFFSNRGISAGTGIAVTEGGGTASIGIDTATVPTLGGTNTFTGTSDFSAATVTLPNLTGMGVIGCGVGDPAGSALATGVLCYVVAPRSCTIKSWDILVDSGTATAGIWKIASGTAIPTVANSIVASAAPAIASGTAIHSTTMTAWTTAVTQFDIFGFNLTTTSGPKYIYVAVNCN